MVKEVRYYECEICSSKYQTCEEALKCERKGIEKSFVNIGDKLHYVLKVESFGDKEEVFELEVIDVTIEGHQKVYHFEEYVSEDGGWYASTILPYVEGNNELRKILSVKE